MPPSASLPSSRFADRFARWSASNGSWRCGAPPILSPRPWHAVAVCTAFAWSQDPLGYWHDRSYPTRRGYVRLLRTKAGSSAAHVWCTTRGPAPLGSVTGCGRCRNAKARLLACPSDHFRARRRTPTGCRCGRRAFSITFDGASTTPTTR